mmetsp:Transcript_21141/g.49542  ORF Transcript_21141/g.49542 Transcript_21141/m.49542 type:complete len:294 (-) Transcript_21141:11225-12106(-)
MALVQEQDPPTSLTWKYTLATVVGKVTSARTSDIRPRTVVLLVAGRPFLVRAQTPPLGFPNTSTRISVLPVLLDDLAWQVMTYGTSGVIVPGAITSRRPSCRVETPVELSIGLISQVMLRLVSVTSSSNFWVLRILPPLFLKVLRDGLFIVRGIDSGLWSTTLRVTDPIWKRRVSTWIMLQVMVLEPGGKVLPGMMSMPSATLGSTGSMSRSVHTSPNSSLQSHTNKKSEMLVAEPSGSWDLLKSRANGMGEAWVKIGARIGPLASENAKTRSWRQIVRTVDTDTASSGAPSR